MTKILMVCMGNICRSPLAEGVLQGMLSQNGLTALYTVESAGTHGHYHAGEPPDPRALAAAGKRGYTQLAKQRARAVTAADFVVFDVIVAMDHHNLAELQNRCPAEHQHKLKLLLDFAEGGDVPDPYYGNAAGFEHVLDLCEAGVGGLLKHLQNGPQTR